MDRILTYNEEKAIRLCHHDHYGLSIDHAAIVMDCKSRAIRRLLCNAKKKAPQLFPILTREHRAILAMYDTSVYELQDRGPHKDTYILKRPSKKAMAEALGLSINQLTYRVAFLRKHGYLFNRVPDQYRPEMEGDVKEKF